jgi:hypothetical protein
MMRRTRVCRLDETNKTKKVCTFNHSCRVLVRRRKRTAPTEFHFWFIVVITSCTVWMHSDREKFVPASPSKGRRGDNTCVRQPDDGT